MGKSKPSYSAGDKKFGLSLAELNEAVAKFNREAEEMKADPYNVKITTLINFSGGIKSITAEV